MAYGMVATGVSLLMIAFAGTPWMTLPAALLLGGSWALVGITILGVIIDDLNPENTMAYNTISIQAIGLATFIDPILGNILLSAHLNLFAVLLIGAAVRIIAGIVIHNMADHSHNEDLRQVAEMSR